jgi:hypothetical protein
MSTNPTGMGNDASRGAIRRHRWHAKGRPLLAPSGGSRQRNLVPAMEANRMVDGRGPNRRLTHTGLLYGSRTNDEAHRGIRRLRWYPTGSQRLSPPPVRRGSLSLLLGV